MYMAFVMTTLIVQWMNKRLYYQLRISQTKDVLIRSLHQAHVCNLSLAEQWDYTPRLRLDPGKQYFTRIRGFSVLCGFNVCFGLL